MTAAPVRFEFDQDRNTGVWLRLAERKPELRAAVVEVTGYVDIYNADHFLKQVGRLAGEGCVHLVLDMTGVHFLASNGIGALVQLVRAARSRGGAVVLVGIAEKVWEVFLLLGFSTFFTVASTVGGALDQLGQPEAPCFPLTFRCPICSRRLRVPRAGRFRCRECRTALGVSDHGEVRLG